MNPSKQLHRRAPLAAIAALAFAGSPAFAAADAVDGATYRCPNNDYKNTISAKEAERLGCKRLDGAPVTIIQMARPRPAQGAGGQPVPAASGGNTQARIDPASQRARDSDARRILEMELKTEEARLADMKRDYNGGQPERNGNEKNYQKYVERVAEMSAAIARKEGDIAAIKRELAKLPPAPPGPTL